MGATGYGGLKPFVDDLKYRLHLHWIAKGFGEKLWGYKLGALVLVLLCRPQLGAKSIAGLREKLLARFICRLFYTVLKHYTEENRALVASINSRSEGRIKVRDGFWVTEVYRIYLPKYITTQPVRCFVIRMRGNKPWAVITNDKSTDAISAAQFYLRRNLVEKVIQELWEDYSLAKLPRSAFDENTCWVLMAGFSYNLWLDFKMTIFGRKQIEILRRKLAHTPDYRCFCHRLLCQKDADLRRFDHC